MKLKLLCLVAVMLTGTFFEIYAVSLNDAIGSVAVYVEKKYDPSRVQSDTALENFATELAHVITLKSDIKSSLDYYRVDGQDVVPLFRHINQQIPDYDVMYALIKKVLQLLKASNGALHFQDLGAVEAAYNDAIRLRARN